jgi:hypothetical protein
MWERLGRERPAKERTVGEREDLEPPAAVGGGAVGAGAERLGSAVAGLALLFVLAWNLATLDAERHEAVLRSPLGTVARTLGLGQRWAMFAPHPSEDDGWYVMPGTTAGGREVDAWRSLEGEPVAVDWSKPPDVAASFGSKRWSKYLANLSLESYRHHRPLFGDWVCRTWNATHASEDRLVEFSMVFLLERYAAPLAKPEPLLLWVERCDEA